VRLREGGQRPGEEFFKPSAKLQTSSVICLLSSVICLLASGMVRGYTTNSEAANSSCPLSSDMLGFKPQNCQLPTANCRLPAQPGLSSVLWFPASDMLPTANCQLPAQPGSPSSALRAPSPPGEGCFNNYPLPLGEGGQRPGEGLFYHQRSCKLFLASIIWFLFSDKLPTADCKLPIPGAAGNNAAVLKTNKAAGALWQGLRAALDD